MPRKRRTRKPVAVEATTHASAKRLNIPTAEDESLVPDDDRQPRPVRYPRNTDLDPQLVWRGKDEQDWSDLVVPAPPLYIQEKVEPKALVDDLLRETKTRRDEENPPQPTLFADFNGLPEGAERTEFYQHRGNWSNRMILGDSLRVMASLAEREGLRGKVQCIYFDPPYGIKFNSNFQWSTTSRDVKDGKQEHISREPEQVKAFRDTWRDGIHSYLTYLRDRLTVARDLLTDSGSIFVQIGDENAHRVRAVLDDVFGSHNFVDQIVFQTSSGRVSDGLDAVYDVLLWYAKDQETAKIRKLRKRRSQSQLDTAYNHLRSRYGEDRPLTAHERTNPGAIPQGWQRFRPGQTQSQGGGDAGQFVFRFEREEFIPPKSRHWSTTEEGLRRVGRAARLMARGRSVAYVQCDDDNPMIQMTNIWTDTVFVAFGSQKAYIVQTNTRVVERCILMTTDPGDLVLDPTCGSGTTPFVAEQWGRRWITIDTSRVALALARSRVMGARYPYYTLADSADGLREEAKIVGREPKSHTTHGDIRQGFVYQRVPHITLKAIATNSEIDTIWEQRRPAVEAALAALNEALRDTRRRSPSAAAPGNDRPWTSRRPPRPSNFRTATRRPRTACSNGRSRATPRTTGRRERTRRSPPSGKPASHASRR